MNAGNEKSILSNLFQTIFTPLHVAMTAIETVALLYFAFYILHSLETSRRFREQSGTVSDPKLRSLWYLIISLTLSFCLLPVLNVVMMAVDVFVYDLDSITQCVQQQMDKVTELSLLSLKESTCFPPFHLFEIGFFVYFSEFFILLSQKFYSKFSHSK